jgi:multiple sugar transport system permease protein
MSTALKREDTTLRVSPQARRRRTPWERYALWVLLGLGAVFMLGPFYWMAITSLKTQSEALAFPPTWWPQNPTLENWRGLTNLTFGSFTVFFRNSLFVTSAVTALTLLTSAMAGYMFAKLHFRGRDLLFWIVLGMMMIPFTVSIIPLYSLMGTLGWRNSYLSLIVPIAFTPFGIFLMRQFMSSLPDELIDAARIDGAGEFSIFFRILLPLSTAALSALGIFTFVTQWDSFLWPLVMIDDVSLYTIPLGLAQFRGRVGTDIGATAAGSMLAVLPVLIIYFAAQRQFVEGIALTGIKG